MSFFNDQNVEGALADLDIEAQKRLTESYEHPTIPVEQREATHVGSRYKGEVSIKTGRREGEGTYFYPNSYFQYEGQWLNGKKHGTGRLALGNGGYYQGEFHQGEIAGQGYQYWPDGSSYTGQFGAGHRHGDGSMKRRDGSKYEGSWQFNKYGGPGKLTLKSGVSYVGEFLNHKYHGKGVLLEPSKKRRYEGFFKDGLYDGDGRLEENSQNFVYEGQFSQGSMTGQGRGEDVTSGISYSGSWSEGRPTQSAISWDFGAPDSCGEEFAGQSFLVMAFSEAFMEEAKNQTSGAAAADPKAKAKAKAKGKDAPVAAEEEGPTGPQLVLVKGEPMPEVILRTMDSENAPLTGDAGRRFRVSMYRERQRPSAEDPSQMETLRREVRFGDMRPTYVDPLDEADAPAAKAKAAPAKGAPAATEVEETEAEPPSIGEEAICGVIGEQGQVTIGGSEAWRIPSHLQPLIYWLLVEDVTEKVGGSSFFPRFSPLAVPVRVKGAE